MALRLPEHWLWDFWFAQDAHEVHAFYLQAPRSLGDPPLTPEAAAQQALAVVYEEAVRAATALAAVDGLLAGEPE